MIMWCQRLVRAIINKVNSNGSAVIIAPSIGMPFVVMIKNAKIRNKIVGRTVY